jgi:D-alanine-D-alanine ligase
MRVAVLGGGRTPERDVSLRSGRRVTNALGLGGHDAWLVDPGEIPLVEALQERAPDICYLTLHGKEGEDGTVQRLLDLLETPYTGTEAFDCEVAFDKVLAKDALARVGIATPDWVVIQGWALRDLGAGAALPKATERVGLPCVVKHLVPDPRSVSERWSDPPIWPRRAWLRCRSRTRRSLKPKSRIQRWPEEIGTACTAEVLKAAQGLHLRDVARVDTIVDARGKPSVLEVNVAPGMTETRLLPMATQAAGWTLAELCERVLRSATTR